MGCIQSRPGEDDVVRRFNARKRFMKQAVLQRHAFAAAHYAYLIALRNTGNALRSFAEGESKDGSSTPKSQSKNALLEPLPPPPLPTTPSNGQLHRTSSLPSSSSGRKGGAPLSSLSRRERGGDDAWSPGSSPEKSDTPPPPSPQKSGWDIFNPFRPSSPPFQFHESSHRRRRRSSQERRYYVESGEVEEAYERQSTALANWESSNTQDFSAIVRIDNDKDLLDIVKQLDEQFLKASSCGTAVSKLLETRKGHFTNEGNDSKKAAANGASNMFTAFTNWAKSPLSGSDDLAGAEAELLMGSHALTLEKLYAWEKKLFNEVKSGEALRVEHQKKTTLLRSQEAKGEDPSVIEKTRAAIKRLHSLIMVSYQGVAATTASVKKMRDEELYPQLVELAEGLMYMWRTVHECHSHQKQIVLLFKNLDSWIAHEATTDYHHHATLELEKEINNWHDCFCKLVSSHREYITALNGWARLSMMEIDLDEANKENEHSMMNEDLYSAPSSPPRNPPVPALVNLCEEWQKCLDRLPDKVASEAIKSLAVVVHGLVVQQSEEIKQKKKVERVSKRLEKKIMELNTAEKKQLEAAARTPPPGSSSKKSDFETEIDDESMSTDSDRVVSLSDEGGYSTPIHSSPVDPLTERKAAVDALKKKLEEVKLKHSKCVQDTRVLTMNNMQTGLPGVFEAMTGFSAVCGQAFQTLYNQAISGEFRKY